MAPKEKAEDLVNRFKLELMEVGNEVLCTTIAKINAIICVHEVINATADVYSITDYWLEVEKELAD